MTINKLTNEQIRTRIEALKNAAGDSLCSTYALDARLLEELLTLRELLARAKAMMYQSGGTPIQNTLNPVDAFLYDAECAGLHECDKVATPELKPAHLINKFYERYPLAGFKTDSERSEALGYFMAGAELQCFGEFIKYEDLCGDD